VIWDCDHPHSSPRRWESFRPRAVISRRAHRRAITPSRSACRSTVTSVPGRTGSARVRTPCEPHASAARIGDSERHSPRVSVRRRWRGNTIDPVPGLRPRTSSKSWCGRVPAFFDAAATYTGVDFVPLARRSVRSGRRTSAVGIVPLRQRPERSRRPTPSARGDGSHCISP
jgi:hypothetical protein